MTETDEGLRLEPDDDAQEFAAAVADVLAHHADRPALRAAWDSAGGRIEGLWQRLAEMGAPGLLVPESAGGAGLDLTAALPLLVAAGRAAAPEPLTTTVAGAAILAAADASTPDWQAGIADGSVSVGLGVGPGEAVLQAGWADLLILRDPAGDAVHVVPAADVELTAQPSVDHGVRLATAQWTPEPATRLGGVTSAQALDITACCLAAELLGLTETMLDLSVDYARTREQFGQVIGAFQAVKHHLADVYVALAFARPVTARAMWSVARNEATRARDASHALSAAGTAARLAARTALQVHGGIGYTYEHDLHMWLKRTWTLTSVLGDPDWHRQRVARAVLGTGS